MGTMLAGGADQAPTVARSDERWFLLDALVGAFPNLAHRLLDDRAARLRRPVREIDARLPAAVVGLVGHVEDEETAHGRLAGCHLKGLPVVRGLDPFGHGLGELPAVIELALRGRNLGIDSVLVVED